MIKENLVFGNIDRCRNKYWEIKDIKSKPSDKCRWNEETNKPMCFDKKGLPLCPYAVNGGIDNSKDNICEDSLCEYEKQEHNLYFCTARVKPDYVRE